MPRKGITAYDLLISCPGDVLNYLDVIKESVENFNRVFGCVFRRTRPLGPVTSDHLIRSYATTS